MRSAIMIIFPQFITGHIRKTKTMIAKKHGATMPRLHIGLECVFNDIWKQNRSRKHYHLPSQTVRAVVNHRLVIYMHMLYTCVGPRRCSVSMPALRTTLVSGLQEEDSLFNSVPTLMAFWYKIGGNISSLNSLPYRQALLRAWTT